MNSIFYKKGAKTSWFQDLLQFFPRKIGAPGGQKFAKNLATTKFRLISYKKLTLNTKDFVNEYVLLHVVCRLSKNCI